MSQQVNYHAGLAAEQAVAARYLRNGYRLLEHRWRGEGGEIDLIFERDGAYVFVEVKKSRDFDRAAESLGARQIARLRTSGAAYLGQRPGGVLSDARFDVALVNQIGDIEIIENALCD